MGDLFRQSSAVLSACGRYRYRLDRRWGEGPTCGFIMLNPSTADADQDDPTIRRCIGFAKREGCGSLVVGNLFALRATDPAELRKARDPNGPENWHFLCGMAGCDGPLIAAWGSHAMAQFVGPAVLGQLRIRVMCLGKTKDGYPRHPLYVRADAPLVPLN